MNVFAHDPHATLDYTYDFTAALIDDDTITTAEVLVDDDTITLGDVTHDDTTVTAWISGGTVDTVPTVTFRITTGAGRTDDRSIMLRVNER